MKSGLTWKFVVIGLVIGLSALSLATRELRQGLDLQGGIHLVLEVQTEKAVESTVERLTAEIKDELRRKRIKYKEVEALPDRRLRITLREEERFADAEDLMVEFQSLSRASRDPNTLTLVYRMDDQVAGLIRANAVDQGLETIRNRVDEFGVAEPSIQREGENRIIVQLPGIDDPERAIRIIGKTALLEFKLVDEENSLQAALEGSVPEGDRIYYQRVVDPETGEERRSPFLLKDRTLLTGATLTNAEMRIGTQFNEAYVSLTFDREGARQFAKITEENVQKRLAIVLDGNVYSAPVIREAIPGGRAQITGIFSTQEAHDLAIALRAGSLPAPVEVLENRTVGASLGKDSVRQGLVSIYVGGLIVVGFMIFYYGYSGLIAVLALLLNLVILLGLLAYFRATLTLPGIAGIILTIGMAVDANVLIFERVREELRAGKSIRAAVDGGYSKAFLTILDSNITTIIAAVVLFQFGTGPIKGFAITLSIGILASMFTAIFVTRVVYDSVVLRKRKLVKLSI